MVKNIVHLNRQLKFLYIYSFAIGLNFWYGIEQLFLEDIADGVFARGVTVAVFSITMFLTNMFTGALSDIWGRVRSLKLGMIFMTVAIIVFGLSNGVVMYAIGGALFAVFWSFDEGAKQAFVYDTLKDHDKKSDYQKIIGKLYALLFIGAAVANFSSGFLAELTSLRAVYFMSLASCMVAIYALTKLDEPVHHKQVGSRIFAQLGQSLRTVSKSKLLVIIVAAQTFIFVAELIAEEFTQVAIVELSKSPITLGIIWGILGLLLAAGNLYAYKIRNIKLVMAFTVAALAALVVFREGWLGIVALVLFSPLIMIMSLKGEHILQNNTPSRIRATISSLPGTLSMLLSAVALVVIGIVDGPATVKILFVSGPLMLLIVLLWLSVWDEIKKVSYQP